MCVCVCLCAASTRSAYERTCVHTESALLRPLTSRACPVCEPRLKAVCECCAQTLHQCLYLFWASDTPLRCLQGCRVLCCRRSRQPLVFWGCACGPTPPGGCCWQCAVLRTHCVEASHSAWDGRCGGIFRRALAAGSEDMLSQHLLACCASNVAQQPQHRPQADMHSAF